MLLVLTLEPEATQALSGYLSFCTEFLPVQSVDGTTSEGHIEEIYEAQAPCGWSSSTRTGRDGLEPFHLRTGASGGDRSHSPHLPAQWASRWLLAKEALLDKGHLLVALSFVLSPFTDFSEVLVGVHPAANTGWIASPQLLRRASHQGCENFRECMQAGSVWKW